MSEEDVEIVATGSIYWIPTILAVVFCAGFALGKFV